MNTTKSHSRHPKGLWVLFGTEMWERFNFYGMRALLTLFMIHSLGIIESQTSLIYGGFLALCYLTPMLGGLIADRYLGNRNCIIIGGFLMGIGQLVMFVSASLFGHQLDLAKNLLWIALGIIILGNGFFKPNISSMVGSLYPKQEKNKLDSAFTIFYMGINLGSFLGMLICPLLGDIKSVEGVRDIHAFRWGFLAAAIAMFLGIILFFLLKNKYVTTPEGRVIGGLPKHNTSEDFEEGEAQSAKFSSKAIAIAIAGFIILGWVFYKLVGQNLVYSLVYAAGITLASLIISDSSITKVERDRILVIYVVSFFVIFFWAAFEQAGSSLTFIADNQTDRSFLGWEMPPSMVQIFNGLFIVVLAVPFSLLWDKLRRSGKEPASPFKQAMGLLIIALSYFVIAHNVEHLGNSGLLAIKWLILLYLLHTCGELCLSPIGLSLVGKLAPKRFASLLYGVFFISSATGYALAGTLGSIMPATGDKFKKAQQLGINLQDVLDKKIKLTGEQAELLVKNNIPLAYHKFAGFEIHNLYEFFMVFVVLCGVAGILLAIISPKLKKMMHGIN
ncbi:MFS transporter [Elizabethkingia argentiflava]|uniref:MFS transporter n=1 Tax=Elizabethkingia argenteiflava TaxID=2681556 RepID=A0A845PWB2_9FLAO|nr:peptide MFS transporter [Elizabethkingia argenteiflava]NAW50737.1 MFS transporter [Elizabethkingia argenteiflava]